MKTSSEPIRAKAYVLGDNIDTDQIIPAQYLHLVPTIPEEYAQLGRYAFSGLPDSLPPFVRPGDNHSPYGVVIAGRNFGCGSSREHAPVALAAAGVRAVVAESYARIFFRNAVATGKLYPLETTARLSEALRTGDEVEIDLDGLWVRVADGRVFPLRPLGDLRPVIEAGGLFAYARATGIIRRPEGHP